uniref:Uncharacterized protein n=1 Tax=Caenorhabditis tropicalis TaxID=1561998 RepID=A0A1I7TD85_9PELO
MGCTILEVVPKPETDSSMLLKMLQMSIKETTQMPSTIRNISLLIRRDDVEEIELVSIYLIFYCGYSFSLRFLTSFEHSTIIFKDIIFDLETLMSLWHLHLESELWFQIDNENKMFDDSVVTVFKYSDVFIYTQILFQCFRLNGWSSFLVILDGKFQLSSIFN